MVLLVGALAFWAGKHAITAAPQARPASVAATVPAGAPAVAGTRYVHRNNSVLRDAPKASGHTLKKEAKGARVILLSVQDGWAKVTDGNITGYMRASVLGTEPPN